MVGAKARIASHLDATSDHRPLIATVPSDQDSRKQPKNCDLIHWTTPAASHSSPLISPSAYRGSAKKTLSQGIGQPWWNNECLCSKTPPDHQAVTTTILAR
ncbi:hypothetical protein TSTA_069660 [Talaromyces stipitatus ATCC 10500]|uniref:Endonuclease/exonuclease/phosphatase domain-containing protein n=1 Tax=Talaromyces stipitatus (strain ATCC 10500 / CBS 375.48 / QM 6759 / NRRL 1006) TaxID=441959 RepID=B8LT40_TALSN|nr:uncharacterized protein TSTA_069660 [Talaromyces stipitatus ATCC 10500]EED23548.1 hypothetical protein TSTA_069660 [Talaromyces stipitatus ATCC 10500]